MRALQRSLSIIKSNKCALLNKCPSLRPCLTCHLSPTNQPWRTRVRAGASLAHALDSNLNSDEYGDSDTIAAVVTGGHEGGVAIIRMSGQLAVSTATKLFKRSAPPVNQDASSHKSNSSQFSPTSHRIYYGHVVDTSGQVLDEVLMLPMLKPRSYTREDVVELHCHGGGVCAQRILEACLQQGCRLAEPGEFTLRAFLNGRLDLSQAESVAQLVTARTASAADSALAGLQGGIAEEIRTLRKQLVGLLAEIEARIDFDDEVPPVDTQKLATAVQDVQQAVEEALGTARRGRVLRGGVQVAIVGRPNVGKSSLLNRLCGADRAIVTNIPGTTRDVVDVQVDISGIPMTLLDTAGVRSTEDAVEAIGVERSERAAGEADVIMFVYDAAACWSEADSELFDRIWPTTDGENSTEKSAKPAILVANKRDLVAGDVATQSVPDRCLGCFKDSVAISATTGTNLSSLESALEGAALSGTDNLGKGRAWAVNERQAAALIGTQQSLNHLSESIETGLPLDFWTIDLRAAVDLLGEVTGDVVTEEILGTVFAKFCIGK